VISFHLSKSAPRQSTLVFKFIFFWRSPNFAFSFINKNWGRALSIIKEKKFVERTASILNTKRELMHALNFLLIIYP